MNRVVTNYSHKQLIGSSRYVTKKAKLDEGVGSNPLQKLEESESCGVSVEQEK